MIFLLLVVIRSCSYLYIYFSFNAIVKTVFTTWRFSLSLFIIIMYSFSHFLPQVSLHTKPMEGLNQSIMSEFVFFGTHQLLGHPTISFCVLLHILCGKHDGKLINCVHCGFRPSLTLSYVLSVG